MGCPGPAPGRGTNRRAGLRPGSSFSVSGVAVVTTEFRVSTRGDADIIDITGKLQAAITDAGVDEAQATAFVRGSTAAITTMELEPGGVHDLRALLDRLIPVHGDYEHNRLNHDTNSHAHQRASMVGSSEVVPVLGGRPALGTWQQLVLIDFDDRPRERTVVVQVVS
jgi:secondary thiamine-phosphate synthase enzyme